MISKLSDKPTDSRLTFGKYEGRLISDILIINPSYIKRLVKKKIIILPKHLKL